MCLRGGDEHSSRSSAAGTGKAAAPVWMLVDGAGKFGCAERAEQVLYGNDHEAATEDARQTCRARSTAAPRPLDDSCRVGARPSSTKARQSATRGGRALRCCRRQSQAAPRSAISLPLHQPATVAGRAQWSSLWHPRATVQAAGTVALSSRNHKYIQPVDPCLDEGADKLGRTVPRSSPTTTAR